MKNTILALTLFFGISASAEKIELKLPSELTAVLTSKDFNSQMKEALTECQKRGLELAETKVFIEDEAGPANDPLGIAEVTIAIIGARTPAGHSTEIYQVGKIRGYVVYATPAGSGLKQVKNLKFTANPSL